MKGRIDDAGSDLIRGEVYAIAGIVELYVVFSIRNRRGILFCVVFRKFLFQHTLAAAVQHGFIFIHTIQFGNLLLIQFIISQQYKLAEVENQNGKQYKYGYNPS